MAAWYYSNEALIVLQVLSRAQPSQEPVQRPRLEPLPSLQLYRIPTAIMGWVSLNCRHGFTFPLRTTHRYVQKPPCANPMYTAGLCVCVCVCLCACVYVCVCVCVSLCSFATTNLHGMILMLWPLDFICMKGHIQGSFPLPRNSPYP